MSDRRFKTARQLGITEQERAALLRVREKLASKVMRYQEEVGELASNDHPMWSWTDKPIFNMAHCWNRFECGQVGCIGGWVAFEMGLDDCDGYVARAEDTDGPSHNQCSKTLGPLFFPPERKYGDYTGITTRQAVNAIDKFMSGVKYPWGAY